MAVQQLHIAEDAFLHKTGLFIAAAGGGVFGQHAQTDTVQVQPRKAEIGEQAGRLGAQTLAAGTLLTDEDAVLGAAVVGVDIAVIDRADRLALSTMIYCTTWPVATFVASQLRCISGVKVWRKMKFCTTDGVLRHLTIKSVSASVMGRSVTAAPSRMGSWGVFIKSHLFLHSAAM